jgi:hypothetical protein
VARTIVVERLQQFGYTVCARLICYLLRALLLTAAVECNNRLQKQQQ